MNEMQRGGGIKELYKAYVEVCKKENITPMSDKTFYIEILDNVLSFIGSISKQFGHVLAHGWTIGEDGHMIGLYAYSKGVGLRFAVTKEEKDDMIEYYKDLSKRLKSPTVNVGEQYD